MLKDLKKKCLVYSSDTSRTSPFHTSLQLEGEGQLSQYCTVCMLGLIFVSFIAVTISVKCLEICGPFKKLQYISSICCLASLKQYGGIVI